MLSSVAPKAAFATWSRDGEIQAIHQDNFVAASSPSSLAPSAAGSPLPLNPSTIKEVGGPSNWNQHGDAQGSSHKLSAAREDMERSQVSGDLGYVSEGLGFKSLDVVKSPYSADIVAQSLETVSLEMISLDRRIASNAIPSRQTVEVAKPQQSETQVGPSKEAPEVAEVRKSSPGQETKKDPVGSPESSAERAILSLLSHDVIVRSDSTTSQPINWRHQAEIQEEDLPQAKPTMTSKEIAAMLM